MTEDGLDGGARAHLAFDQPAAQQGDSFMRPITLTLLALALTVAGAAAHADDLAGRA
jgi:predicted ATPase